MNEEVKYTQLCKRLGYRFTDRSLLAQALTHRSAGQGHNERLEFLGDSVLGVIIAQMLFHAFPRAPEGSLTRMRSSLVKGDTLADIGRELQLGEHLKLGSGEMKSGGSQRASILEDAVEAVLGAIYLDAGFAECELRIEHWFARRFAQLDPDLHPKDPKTRLQEVLQGNKQPLPEYAVVDVSGKDHAQTFVVECSIKQTKEVFVGRASSRRKAEQKAAQLVLEKMNYE